MKQIGSIIIVVFAFVAMTASLYAFDADFQFRIDQWRNKSTEQSPKSDNIQVPSTPIVQPNLPIKNANSSGIWAKIDAHALNAPSKSLKNVPALADYLSKGAKNDMEKARAIFRWMAKNIRYDDDAYNSKDLTNWTAEEVLARKKGVCGNFAVLFVALADASGLEAVKISGYSKGFGYSEENKMDKVDHAWNAFKADGSWHLMDVTWGEGYGKSVNGKLKSTKKFDPFWFDTDPNAFLFSHLPEESKWQLIPNPINLSTYQQMAYAYHSMFQMGFNNAGLLQAARTGKLKSFAEVYDNDLAVRAIQANPEGVLSEEKSYPFTFECMECSEMAFVNNSGWNHLEKEGDRFSGTIWPSAGTLVLYGRKNKKTSFSGILNYKVIAKSGSVAKPAV